MEAWQQVFAGYIREAAVSGAPDAGHVDERLRHVVQEEAARECGDGRRKRRRIAPDLHAAESVARGRREVREERPHRPWLEARQENAATARAETQRRREALRAESVARPLAWRAWPAVPQSTLQLVGSPSEASSWHLAPLLHTLNARVVRSCVWFSPSRVHEEAATPNRGCH